MRDVKNHVQLLGNLGQDVKSGTTKDGKNWANFSLATTKKWTIKETGESKESTQWHNVGCFGKLADLATKYLQKGSKVLVVGSINYREYTNENGVKMKSTSIEANDFVFLSSPNGGASGQSSTPSDDGEDLPF